MACNPIEAIDACRPSKNKQDNSCGDLAAFYAGGYCPTVNYGGEVATNASAVDSGYSPRSLNAGSSAGSSMGAFQWGALIESYMDPNDSTPPRFLVNGNGQPNGTGPNFSYYLTGDPSQQRYPLIYDLSDPNVIDMLGGRERWSGAELTALGNSAMHKPPEKQALFFEAVAAMVASPTPWTLNEFTEFLYANGYENHDPQYQSTEVPAWYVWAQEGDAYNLRMT
ncbi:hypothetical protein [Limnobacter parvus]|uniref:Uncharacterized protein n=1 Tax=Limnobacter parvus TaxID=2939690 RepID=A0ABT1XK92_9BURK|nr:hypothetical protein [Limnobacter parvus]MCR2747695.1 hypothetical protein [Limnobacter parvus]